MPWYTGPSLLSFLEALRPKTTANADHFRFPIQTVVRPKTEGFHDFRGYAGKVYGGGIKVGDAVVVLPSRTHSTVKEIHYYDQQYQSANPGSAITLTLADAINIARGDMLVKATELPRQEKQIDTTVCWMDTDVLTAGKKYILQHNTHKVWSKVSSVSGVLATDFSGEQVSQSLALNQIGGVQLQLAKPLYFDAYTAQKSTGAFILIDPQTNTTAAVGFIK